MGSRASDFSERREGKGGATGKEVAPRIIIKLPRGGKGKKREGGHGKGEEGGGKPMPISSSYFIYTGGDGVGGKKKKGD